MHDNNDDLIRAINNLNWGVRGGFILLGGVLIVIASDISVSFGHQTIIAASFDLIGNIAGIIMIVIGTYTCFRVRE